jgi:hypothetical protein
MRKLLSIVVLCLALAVPAAASGDVLLDAGLADPFAVHEAERKLRIAKQRAKPPEPKPVPVPPHLKAIAQCESGGDPTAIGGGGLYRGKYQFSVETWRAVGGKGDPAAAPEAEQDRRAVLLYNQSGPGQWPVCGS